MRLTLFFIILLSSQVYSLTELVPSQNFAITIDSTIAASCTGLERPDGLDNIASTNPEVTKHIDEVKKELAIGRLSARSQSNLIIAITIPPAYLVAGYECEIAALNSLRNSLAAIQLAGQELDDEATKLDFEIGDNFAGPGANEITEVREAAQFKGKLGKNFEDMIDITNAGINGLKTRRPGEAGIAASHNLISVLTAVQNTTIRVKNAMVQLKEIEDELEHDTSSLTQEVEDSLKELQRQDIDQLDLFQLKIIGVEPSNTLIIDGTFASSPAGLMKESEANLAQAKTLYTTSKTFKNRARTANKLTNLDKAFRKLQLAKQGSEESLTKTLAILSSLQEQALKEENEAESIDKPFAATLTKKEVENLKTSGTYFEKIIQLSRFIKNIREIKAIYSEEAADKEDKVKLKLRIIDLEFVASQAEKKGIQNAGEITSSLKEAYASVNKVTTKAELLALENDVDQYQQILYGLVEERFGDVKQLYTQAEDLQKSAALSPAEEKAVNQLRDSLLGAGIVDKISNIDDIQNQLKQIIANNSKKVPSIVETSNSQNTQPNVIFDSSSALQKLRDAIEEGTKAFHTDGSAKKTLDELSYDEALKQAQKIAKDLEKKPNQQTADALANQIEKMNTAIQGIQHKAGIEIAIAEQRGLDVNEASKKWESGEYASALEVSQKMNKENAASLANDASKVTGQVVKADDNKLWAIGVSLVIILIGAAYLFYVKKNESP